MFSLYTVYKLGGDFIGVTVDSSWTVFDFVLEFSESLEPLCKDAFGSLKGFNI